MKIKKMIKYYFLGESLKEIEVCRILDKICKNKKLTHKEKSFLDLYNETAKKEDKDYMLLSKSVVSVKIKELIDNSKVVICDLHDRDGKIGVQIVDVINDYDSENSYVIMKDNKTHQLHEKFLYNLIYNTNKNLYSLQEHDEYFEKIEAKSD
jgi:hypothetical protein